MPSDLIPLGRDDTGSGLGDLLRFARMDGETSDTRQWLDNLERLLAVAWDLMTEEQRQAFRGHADVLAIAEAAGATPSPG